MRQKNYLVQWLASPEAAEYFGAAFALKSAVLAHLVTGTGSLAEIARTHAVTLAAVYKQRKAALKFLEKKLNHLT